MKLLRFTLTILLITASVVVYSQETITHIVAKGETVSTICSKYGLSEEDLLKENPALKNYIYVGMKIRIPASASAKKVDNAPQVSQKEEMAKTDLTVSHQDKVSDAPPRVVTESPSTSDDSTKPAIQNENRNRWLGGFKFRYYMPPKIKNAYTLGFSFGAGYFPVKFLLLEGHIGYSGGNSWARVDGYDVREETHRLVFNQNVCGFFPIGSLFAISPFMGPEEQLFLTGKQTVGKEVYKMDPSQRFVLLYDFGVRIFVGGVFVGAEYKLGLTTGGGSLWGFSVGYLMNF